MDSAIDWLATRTPPAPDELKGLLEVSGGRAASVAETLLMAGLLRLEEALARPGRDRESAYRLLAADALVTYGCEAASEAADVRGVLRDVLDRVSSDRSVA